MWVKTPRGDIVLWEKGPRTMSMGKAELIGSYSKFSFKVPHN